jgi:hypothetical protein
MLHFPGMHRHKIIPVLVQIRNICIFGEDVMKEEKIYSISKRN